MAVIASFHLVRERRYREPLVMARLGTDRLRLGSVPGLRFHRLLGTGAGDDTAPSADLRRSALFAVWDDEAALEEFLERSPIARRWARAEELWQVRLRGLGGHGSWRGVPIPTLLAPGADSGAVAVITRADVRRAARSAFAAVGRPVSDEVRRADGLLGVVGIGESPHRRLGTFSLWRSLDAMRGFVHMAEHREVIARTRRENWYGEEMFARFEPYGSSGTWAGRDPLGA